MYIYELYYINKYKPPLNEDSKADDEVTIELPDLEWYEFSYHMLDQWKCDICLRDMAQAEVQRQYKEFADRMKVDTHNLSSDAIATARLFNKNQLEALKRKAKEW